MIMKGIFTYDRWGMFQRFVGKLVEEMIRLEYDVPKKFRLLDDHFNSKNIDF